MVLEKKNIVRSFTTKKFKRKISQLKKQVKGLRVPWWSSG